MAQELLRVLNASNRVKYKPMPILDPLIKCAICGKPISLEQSKVSEDGKPVHEQCYLAKVRLEKAKPR
jgi:hypothetical protein